MRTILSTGRFTETYENLNHVRS